MDLKSHKLTPQDIENEIVGEQYHLFPGTTTTVCCLELRNGYTVIGQSACLSVNDFDAAVGREMARKDASSKVWSLMGYARKWEMAKRGEW